jgi:hypothetical protein
MRSPDRRRTARRFAILVACAALLAATAAAQQSSLAIPLPRKDGSLKFALIGDSGTGGAAQYEIGKRMAEAHALYPFELVLMTGDNIYGSERPRDFERKFELPYKALLDAKVKFYASLGNHDERDQRFYKLFNMGGELYYTFKAPKQDVRFFALESTYMDRRQTEWLEKELRGSDSDWKIAFFHHPLYSSGGRHGSDVELRQVVEPLFLKYNVSAVFSGHEHFYERIKPQHGIFYMTSGGAGKLREGNIRPNTALTAKGFDADYHFVLLEIDDDEMYFQAISRRGQTIDSGSFRRRDTPTTSGGAAVR